MDLKLRRIKNCLLWACDFSVYLFLINSELRILRCFTQISNLDLRFVKLSKFKIRIRDSYWYHACFADSDLRLDPNLSNLRIHRLLTYSYKSFSARFFDVIKAVNGESYKILRFVFRQISKSDSRFGFDITSVVDSESRFEIRKTLEI